MEQLLKIGDFIGYTEQPMVEVRVPNYHYMLRVVPNRELKIEERLAEQGVSVYLPKETQTRRTGRNHRVFRRAAIFSGAMFIPDFEADLARLKTIVDGIIGYVRFDANPVKIRPKMMESIRKFEKLLDVPPGQRKRAFYVSQEVRIKGGSFDMWMGYVASLDSKHRLTVLVNLLGRMVPMDLSEDQVEAV
jgi:transcription antitermination factor NusG